MKLGIEETLALQLLELDISSIEDLATEDVNSLVEKLNFDRELANLLVNKAQAYLDTEKMKLNFQDLKLTQIKGIGSKAASKLRKAGISSVKQLKDANLEQISMRSGISPQKLRRWVRAIRVRLRPDKS